MLKKAKSEIVQEQSLLLLLRIVVTLIWAKYANNSRVVIDFF